MVPLLKTAVFLIKAISNPVSKKGKKAKRRGVANGPCFWEWNNECSSADCAVDTTPCSLVAIFVGTGFYQFWWAFVFYSSSWVVCSSCSESTLLPNKLGQNTKDGRYHSSLTYAVQDARMIWGKGKKAAAIQPTRSTVIRNLLTNAYLWILVIYFYSWFVHD